MSESTKKIEENYAIWQFEDAKFVSGNNAAGARARKALGEIAKAIRDRRKEITNEKNARKEAKKS
jgi:hypothetical protein